MALSDNLQGWWCPSLDDDGNGTTTLTDLSGNGNNGTLTNMDAGTDWVADTDNGGVRSLDLDGDNDFISFGTITTSNPLQLASGALTILAWIKPAMLGDLYQRIVDKSTSGGGANGYAFYFDFNGATTIAANGADWRSSFVPTPNEWVLVGVEHVNNQHPRFWVNGSLVSTVLFSTPTTITNVECGLRFGSWNHSTGREYRGRLDSVIVYNRLLTAEEHAAIYNGGRSLNLLASGSSNIAPVLASMQQQQESVVVL